MLLRALSNDEMQKLRGLHSRFYAAELSFAEFRAEAKACGTPLGVEAPLPDIEQSMSKQQVMQALNDSLTPDFVATKLQDLGFWTWLAIQYMDELFGGPSKPKFESAGLIASDGYSRWYRHRLRGPAVIYQAHRENPDALRVILGGPVGSGGEIYGQLAAHREIWSSVDALRFVNRVYLDPKTGGIRKGAASRNAWSADRMRLLWPQLDRTYDLLSLSPEALLEVFPPEFARAAGKVLLTVAGPVAEGESRSP